jgi:peptide/nickel transport system permease protein
MGAYAIRRLTWIPITIILTSMFVFSLVRFIPGSVVDLIVAQIQAGAGQGIAVVDRAQIEHSLGLDKPIYVQYGKWVENIVIHGSLGTSLNNDQDIAQEIMQRLPVTFELGLMAIIIGIIISIPIGVFAAMRQDSIPDYVLRSVAILLISVPGFWLGTMIMIYPSIWWGWSPPMQLISFAKDPIGNLGMFLIPSLVLGTGMTGASMRMTRTMMLEVLRQDYIRTAWAKGLNERVIIIRHALKNALIPVITIIGMQLPILVGGSVIIEQIFVLPGIGRLLLEALSARDYPIVSGVNLILATFVIFVNLAVDLTYGWLDPRIHYQ